MAALWKQHGLVMPDVLPPRRVSTLTHPGWRRTATLYTLNTRCFTPEDTFRAAGMHAALGVVWLMPVHSGEPQDDG